ncbi:MAG: bacteriohemerythrin [Terracidiphilus sp.]|nr:bacteriohemerythrin [Terracidiphilus sp.]
MALLEWNNSLSVGVPSIDAQHCVLISLLNDLHDAMLNGNAQNRTGPLLRSLVSYTRDHFTTEEAMMASAGYSQLKEHRNQHLALTRKVEHYALRYERGESALNLQLLTFLRDWITTHILVDDMAYAPTLKQHNLR